MTRIVIVDDQDLERFHLRVLFKHCANITIVGESNSVEDAANLINREKPDAVFLDIDLGPDSSGFDLLPLIQCDPRIVFVTLYNDFAVRAFQVNALDYLMKPVTLERLQQTLERLNRHTEKEVSPAEQLLKEEDFLHLRGGGRQAFIPLGQLVAIESDGDYTRVHTAATGEFYIRRTMKEWLNMLPSELYQALDRKLIVGIAHIRELQSEDPTHGLLEMNGIDKVFPLGKTALRSARQMLKKLGY